MLVPHDQSGENFTNPARGVKRNFEPPPAGKMGFCRAAVATGLPFAIDRLVGPTSLNGMNSQPVLVGAFEAKTKLGNLLERVGQGASFVITKHDRPVARLVGYDDDKAARRADAVAGMRALRARYRLKGAGIRQLRDEGRA